MSVTLNVSALKTRESTSDPWQSTIIKADAPSDANDITYDSTETYDAGTVGKELSDQKTSLNQLKTDTFGNINLTGTNTTGSTIPIGTFFYNNGALVSATAEIQNGSTITGSNTETVTAGGLNVLKAQFATIALNSNYPIVGRQDGQITIMAPFQGKFSAFELSTTTGLSIDVYGDKSAANFICDFNAASSRIGDGYLYLRFTPRTSYSSCLGLTKPGIAMFYNNPFIILS